MQKGKKVHLAKVRSKNKTQEKEFIYYYIHVFLY